jgi:heptosyltransferase-3
MIDSKRIMLIQLRRIGDVLMCTPALRALRKHLPRSHIVFLTEGECADILALNPYLDELLVLDRERYGNPLYWLKKVWQIRRKRFDLVIDYLGNPRSAYISFISGAKLRVGYDLPGRRFLYNRLVKNEGKTGYAAAQKLEALKRVGIESTDLKLDFLLPKEAELFAQRFFREEGIDRSRLVISISPTSRRSFRRWPQERFAQLADWLIHRFGAMVILVWGPKEKEIVERIQHLMKEKPVISWRTKSLFELGAVIRECDLHLGNDNGTKHIAVAVDKPTITIYGPQDPKSWTYPDPSRHRFLKKEVDCPDCDKIKHGCVKLSCLDKITVEDVQGVLLQLIRDLKENKERSLVQKIENLAVD